MSSADTLITTFRTPVYSEQSMLQDMYYGSYKDLLVRRLGKYTEEDAQYDFQQLCTSSNLIVAEREDTVCGFTVFKDSEAEDNVIDISTIVVDEKFRRQGIGTEIMKEVIKRAKEERKIAKGMVMTSNIAGYLFAQANMPFKVQVPNVRYYLYSYLP